MWTSLGIFLCLLKNQRINFHFYYSKVIRCNLQSPTEKTKLNTKKEDLFQLNKGLLSAFSVLSAGVTQMYETLPWPPGICDLCKDNRRGKSTNNYWWPISFIHLTNTFECSLCARNCSRYRGCRNGKEGCRPCSCEGFIPVEPVNKHFLNMPYWLDGGLSKS